MRINKQQKRLLKITGIIVAVIILFVVLVYLPKDRQLRRLRHYVEVTDTEAKEIQQMLGENVLLESGAPILKERASLLKLKIVKKTDTSLSLKGLSDIANKTGVRIANIKPGLEAPAKTAAGAPIFYNGAPCMMVPVDMMVEGRYENLAKYIYSLENSPAGLYTVNGFSIHKDSSTYPLLKMNLKIGLYYFLQK